MNKDKNIGTFLTLLAGFISLCACITYIFVMYTLPVVFIVLILSVVISVCALFRINKILVSYAPLIMAFLCATAIIWAVNPMVNQLGYVVSGLDDISTVIMLIVSGALMAIAMIISIVSAFLPQKACACYNKEEK